jgi:hypothetical protein
MRIMAFDPFSLVTTTPQPETVEKIVYVPEKPNTVLGIDEKYVLGAIIGVILITFIMEIE